MARRNERRQGRGDRVRRPNSRRGRRAARSRSVHRAACRKRCAPGTAHCRSRRAASVDGEPVIAAHDLTRRFGDFTAVDHVSFTIERGEIFGFVGSNGCGKTTTMKMLTGLLPASEGEALLFGRPLDASDLNARKRVGYMSQSFSLYTELTVRQNLRPARAPVSPAGAQGESAHRRTDRPLRPRRTRRPARRGSAARHPPAALARRRDRA